MRVVLVLLVLAAGCSSPEEPAATTASATAGTTATVEAGSSLEVRLTDPDVRTAVAAFHERGDTGEPFAAYRGPQAEFEKLGCRFYEGAAPDRVELVVYMRGNYTSPSGKTSDVAMVQSLEEGRGLAVLYGNGTPDAGAWCRPPSGY